MTDDRFFLSAGQALAMLDPEAERIHTFVRGPGCILGVDRDRVDLEAEIRVAEPREIGGEACRRINHGLVLWTDRHNPLFVECRKGFDYAAYEESLKADSTNPNAAGLATMNHV